MDASILIYVSILFSLNIICHTFCIVITSKYKLHAFDPLKACPYPHTSLLLKSRVICATMNNHASSGQNFSLELSTHGLVCSNNTLSSSKPCQQVYSKSLPKKGNASFIRPVKLVTAAREEESTSSPNQVRTTQTSPSKGSTEVGRITNG